MTLKEIIDIIPGSEISNPEAYDNDANPKAIYVKVVNTATGCIAYSILNLHVNANPTPLTNQLIINTLGNNGVLEECDGNVDGSGTISEQIALFDLPQWENDILGGESGVSAS